MIKIIDGDTLDILTNDKKTIRIRLEGIDTPERGQAFGTKAKEKLAELTLGKVVSVRSVGKDRYGRELGRITVDGVDVNLELVRAGFAWHYKAYSTEQALADAEQSSREAKRGLWIDPKPIALAAKACSACVDD